jgi:hypothetical protein
MSIKTSAACMVIVMGVPQKTLKKDLRYDVTIPLFHVQLKKCKSGSNRDNYTPMIIAAPVKIDIQ